MSVSLCSGTLKVVEEKEGKRQRQVRGHCIAISWRRHRFHFCTETVAAEDHLAPKLWRDFPDVLLTVSRDEEQTEPVYGH